MINIDDLIRGLKKTNKMDNKHLAKRIQKQTSKPDIKEEKELRKKCFQLLITLINEDTKDKLLRINHDIHTAQIEKTSSSKKQYYILLEEKERILREECIAKEEDNQALVDLLIGYIGYQKGEIEKQKEKKKTECFF